MLYEEIEKFENLTNKKANDFSIAYIGGYLDGYEKGKEDAPTIDPSFITDLDAVKDWRICGYRVEDLLKLALILRDKSIDIYNLRDFTNAFALGYQRATEDLNKSLEESINKCIKEAADNDDK